MKRFAYKQLEDHNLIETDYDNKVETSNKSHQPHHFHPIVQLSWVRLHQCKARLTSTSEMASLMSFFSVTAAVELKLVPNEISEHLVIALAVITSILVALSILVKIVACSIIPYLESVSNVDEIRDVSRSPHEEFISLINVTWLCGAIGLPALFILDLIIMTWIKFSFFSMEAVYMSTGILLPLLIVILGFFSIIFYKQILQRDNACYRLLQCRRQFERQLPTQGEKRSKGKSQNKRASNASTDNWSTLPATSALTNDNIKDIDIVVDENQLLLPRSNTTSGYGSVTNLPTSYPFYQILQ